MKKSHIFQILAAACLLALAGAGCSQRANKTYDLGPADQYFESGEFDLAETNYLKALATDPENAKAIGRLGLIYFDEGRFQKAAPYLYKGSQLSSSNLELRVKLAQICLAVGDRKEAQQHADFVFKNDPADPDAPEILAESVPPAQLGDLQKHFQTLTTNADSPALETALGVVATRQNDLKGALEHFQRALNLDSKFAPGYAALANAYLQFDEVKKAGDAFKAAADCAPTTSPLQTEYGLFEIQAGELAGADKSFSDLTQKEPGYMPAWLGLAEAKLDEKDFDESAAALQKVLDCDPESLDARLLTARLDLARSNTARAIDELESLVKTFRQSAEIHYRLALAYLVGGDTEKAINQLHETVDLNPNFAQAAFLLAQLDVKRGDAESALGLLKPLIARHPNLVEAQLLLADVYRLQNDFSDAMPIYQQLEKSFPKNPEIPLLAGSAFVQQLNENAARAEFNRALQIDPGNATAQEELVQMDLADKNFDAAQQRAEKLVSTNPNRSQPEILLAKVLLDRGQTNQAEDALMKAGSLPNGLQANLLLAQLYFNLKQDHEALDMLNLVMSKTPDNPDLLMFAAEIQTDQKDYSAAAASYEKLLTLKPQFSLAMNNLAWLYSDYLGDLDKAYALAERAHQLGPNDPSTADTLGWIYFKKGQYTQALNMFQQSSAGLPNNPEVLFHFGLAYYMLGNEDSARQELQSATGLDAPFPDRSECQKYLDILNIDPATAGDTARADLEKRISEQPDDPVAFDRLVTIYQREGDTERASVLCQSALKANPNNIKALLLLARVYEGQDPQKAFALAKSAYQLTPNDPVICSTLGHLAFLTGNDQWAFSLLDEASQDQPTNGQTLFDLANAAFCLGKVSEAQADMQNAVQAGLSALQSAQAQNFIQMATICENPDQAAANQSRVESTLASDPKNPAALFVQGLVDTQNNDALGAEHAYENLLFDHPHCAIASKNLAILYAQNLVDPAKAYPVALEAREAFPDDPQVARALAMVLFQQGEYSRAADLFNTISNSTTADARLFYCLGICEYHLRNYIETKTSLERALNLNLSGQDAADARQTLSELH
ncbi:MAG TPA: tetratricopeptide repeat protein [Candidatus Sulfotelmatobacter sp.]|nr:tetratricopeptide repeat protein [Candidatus Sulfotelmatobacter sp.]